MTLNFNIFTKLHTCDVKHFMDAVCDWQEPWLDQPLPLDPLLLLKNKDLKKEVVNKAGLWKAKDSLNFHSP